MPASGRRGGKSKYSASPPSSGNSFKSQPKKKFHPIFSINSINATSSSDNATSGDMRRKYGNNVRTTRTTGRVSNTVQTDMFNVGNKTLEDVATQDLSWVLLWPIGQSTRRSSLHSLQTRWSSDRFFVCIIFLKF